LVDAAGESGYGGSGCGAGGECVGWVMRGLIGRCALPGPKRETWGTLDLC